MTKERIRELRSFIKTTLNGVIHEGKKHISLALPMEEWDELFYHAENDCEE